MPRAKIFRNGGSQAIRLPKEFRFGDDEQEVMVRRVGKRIILEPADEWSPEFLAILGSIDDEIERPKQTSITRMRNPFD